MKKTYVKPMIQFEDFKVSSSIAAGCAITVPTQSEGTCGYPVDLGLGLTFTIFIDKNTACDEATVDGDGYCYHVVDETSKLFNS